MNNKPRSLLIRVTGTSCVVLVLTLTIGSGGSPLTRNDHHKGAVVQHDDHSSVETHRTTHPQSLHDAVVHDDHTAFMALHDYAALHLVEYDLVAETFGSAHDWWPNWTLYWLDVRHGDHAVRVYYAIHEIHPHVQYALTWDYDDRPHATDWVRID